MQEHPRHSSTFPLSLSLMRLRALVRASLPLPPQANTLACACILRLRARVNTLLHELPFFSCDNIHALVVLKGALDLRNGLSSSGNKPGPVPGGGPREGMKVVELPFRLAPMSRPSQRQRALALLCNTGTGTDVGMGDVFVFERDVALVGRHHLLSALG